MIFLSSVVALWGPKSAQIEKCKVETLLVGPFHIGFKGKKWVLGVFSMSHPCRSGEGLVEQQSLKEEIRFPILIPCVFFQPRTQHGKRPSGSENEKIDTGALPTLFFGPNPRPMKVLAAGDTHFENRKADSDGTWVPCGL